MTLLRRFLVFSPVGQVAALVVLLLVVGMAGAWALDFPRLGLPGTPQESIMQTGFAVQWALFGGFSGQKGSALYYLALTSGVIGLLLIVTNSKYRSPSVLVPWFLILLLLLFAPYNSRLLFYPVSPTGTTCTAGVTGKVSGEGTLGDLNGVCGFTPQVVVAHLGTVMTLIMTDIFNSMGMQNAVEGALAGARVRNAPQMVANENTRNALNSYDKTSGCSGVTPILPARLQDTSSSTPTTGTSSTGTALPRTMESMFNQIKDQALSAKPGTRVSLPGIVMPRTYEEGQSLGWSDEQWAQYVNGIGRIYARVVGTGKTVVNTHVGGASASNTIGQDSAVDAIISQVAQNSAAAAKSVGGMAYYLTSPSGTGAELWKQIRTNSSGTVGGEGSTATQFNINGNSGERPIYMRTLADLIKNDDVVRTMPVGKASSTSDLSTCTGVGMGQRCTQRIDTNVGDCKAEAANMFNRMVELQFDQLGRDGSSGIGKRLVDLMLNGGTISADELSKATGPYADLAKSLAQWSATNDGTGNLSGDDLAKYFSNQMVASARQNADQAAGVAKEAQKTPDNMGWTGFLGAPIAALGVLLAGLAGKLSGALAAAFLMVMKSLVDLAIMVMLVVTPLMFMMGLLIPTNAPGMLITTTIGLLVLKLVPMTTVIIDFMIGLARAMSWQTSSSWLSAEAWDGIILGAAAGMYMGVISMTMFIMFKLGDPGNIQQLRGLESAGKQIAEAGKKAAIGLGVIAGTLGFGALTGGVTGALRTGRMAMGDTSMGKLAGRLDQLKKAATSGGDGTATTATEAAPVTEATTDARPEDLTATPSGTEPASPEEPLTPTDAAAEAGKEIPGSGSFDVNDPFTKEMLDAVGGPDEVNKQLRHQRMEGGPYKVTSADGREFSVDRIAAGGKWKAIGGEGGASGTVTADGRTVVSGVGGDGSSLPVVTPTGAAGGASAAGETALRAEGTDTTVATETATVEAASSTTAAADGSAPASATTAAVVTPETTPAAPAGEEWTLDNDKHFKQLTDTVMERIRHMEEAVVQGVSDGFRKGFDQVSIDKLGRPDGRATPLKGDAAIEAEIGALVKNKVISQRDADLILNAETVADAAAAVESLRTRQTEYLNNIGVGKNQDKTYNVGSARWRGAKKGARSGLYGAIQAFKNSGGSIPIIGPIVSEVLNEEREAHDRAVVISMAGGMKDYKRAQKLSERQSFVSKEMGAFSGAENYMNQSVQAQYSNTIQAARQGAAKAVEDFTARARTGRTDASGAFSFSDMRANARMGAISDAEKTAKTAMTITNAEIKMQGGRSVSLNPAVLQEFGAREGAKDIASKIGGSFKMAYSLEPKLESRKVPGLSLSQSGQVAQFVREGVGSDFVWEGMMDNHAGRLKGMTNEFAAKLLNELSRGNMITSDAAFKGLYKLNATLGAAKKVSQFTDPMAKPSKEDIRRAMAALGSGGSDGGDE